MEWFRRQDLKNRTEATRGSAPEDNDEYYFEEDGSVDEGMVRFQGNIFHIFVQNSSSDSKVNSLQRRI